jgi:hypothetical protein
MTAEEIDEFLAEPRHLLRIGVVDETGMPLVVPIWCRGRRAVVHAPGEVRLAVPLPPQPPDLLHDR